MIGDMKSEGTVDVDNIKSKALFVLLSEDQRLISEHATPGDACTALARHYHTTRQEAAIYKKENGEWIKY